MSVSGELTVPSCIDVTKSNKSTRSPPSWSTWTSKPFKTYNSGSTSFPARDKPDPDILLSAASSKINHTKKVDMLNKLINHNQAFQNLAWLLKQHRHFLDLIHLNPDLYSHSRVCKTTSHPSRRQNGMCFCADRPHKRDPSKHYRKSTQHAALRHAQNVSAHTCTVAQWTGEHSETAHIPLASTT